MFRYKYIFILIVFSLRLKTYRISNIILLVSNSCLSVGCGRIKYKPNNVLKFLRSNLKFTNKIKLVKSKSVCLQLNEGMNNLMFLVSYIFKTSGIAEPVIKGSHYPLRVPWEVSLKGWTPFVLFYVRFSNIEQFFYLNSAIRFFSPPFG